MELIPYKKNKFYAFFISLLFTGPGVIFYINPWKGILISIIEVFLITSIGLIPGLLFGIILSISVSFSTIDKERRLWHYKFYKSYPEVLSGEVCPDTIIVIATEEGLKRILKGITFKDSCMLNI